MIAGLIEKKSDECKTIYILDEGDPEASSVMPDDINKALKTLPWFWLSQESADCALNNLDEKKLFIKNASLKNQGNFYRQIFFFFK